MSYTFPVAHLVGPLSIPRKCSATSKLIEAKDHASAQLTVGEVDDNGVYTVWATSRERAAEVGTMLCKTVCMS